jgi:response regulator RpfG family c-di-GMP phosphodiesterase
VLPLANDPSSEGRRIVICDYNALLLSVTGLLRMSGYRVFQAHDGLAARELCHELPNIGLLVLNTTGTGEDTPSLVGLIRREHPDLPILHIGTSSLAGMPSNVPTLAESFTADQLLRTVESLMAKPEITNVQHRERQPEPSARTAGVARPAPVLRVS